MRIDIADKSMRIAKKQQYIDGEYEVYSGRI